MHALEKIFAGAAGKDSVQTGEIVNCKVDLAGINDLYLQTVKSFKEMDGIKVAAPENVVVFLITTLLLQPLFRRKITKL